MLGKEVTAREVIDPHQVAGAAVWKGAKIAIDQHHLDAALPQAFSDASVGIFTVGLMLKRNKKNAAHTPIDEAFAKRFGLFHRHPCLTERRGDHPRPEIEIVPACQAGKLSKNGSEDFGRTQVGHDHPQLRQ